jgi:tRNA dimethylallyltransferase
VIAVVGPTGVGKSDLAVDLALALDGEIVNADAMQLYRGMDIGTAKLTLAERRGVPHHLLDVLDVRDEASVAAYQRQARAALAQIAGRGRRGILVGGSGLYVRAVLDTLDIPPTDPAVRARWEAELDAVGALRLHARLAEVDPQAAANILATNGRRLVRALEVVELTGRPFSASLPSEPGNAVPSLQVGLALPRPVLDERIAVRVDRMWAAGLVEEVRRLDAAGLRRGRTASRALGYAQVLRQLAGECDEAEARADTVRATRKLARRQESWFRRDPRVQWLPAGVPDLAARALAVLRASAASEPVVPGEVIAEGDVPAAQPTGSRSSDCRNVSPDLRSGG